MNASVLVTYASSSGSTREIATVVAETLRTKELTVDLEPMRAVRDLARYSALVFGIPLYLLRWHGDARRFLARHRASLGPDRPTAVFTGGPTQSGSKEEWDGVRDQVAQELSRVPWFKPVSIEFVGGRFDPTRLPFPYNLLPALRSQPASDMRDWAAIRAWASALPDRLLTPAECAATESR